MISRPILSPVIAKINQERVGTESLSEGREDGEQSRRPVRRDASRATEGQPADVCGSLRLQAGSGYFGGSRGGAEEVSDQSCFLLWIKLIENISLLPHPDTLATRTRIATPSFPSNTNRICPIPQVPIKWAREWHQVRGIRHHRRKHRLRTAPKCSRRAVAVAAVAVTAVANLPVRAACPSNRPPA